MRQSRFYTVSNRVENYISTIVQNEIIVEVLVQQDLWTHSHRTIGNGNEFGFNFEPVIYFNVHFYIWEQMVCYFSVRCTKLLSEAVRCGFKFSFALNLHGMCKHSYYILWLYNLYINCSCFRYFTQYYVVSSFCFVY